MTCKLDYYAKGGSTLSAFIGQTHLTQVIKIRNLENKWDSGPGELKLDTPVLENIRLKH